MAEKTNPIPDFDSNGNLPPGLYYATLDDIKAKFTGTPKRMELFEGLLRAVDNLRKAGVTQIFLDGSFTTDKEEPNDIDGCWVPHRNVDMQVLDTVFIDRDPPRQKMKDKYGVDFLIAGYDTGDKGQPIEFFFSADRNDEPKGIVLLNL